MPPVPLPPVPPRALELLPRLVLVLEAPTEPVAALPFPFAALDGDDAARVEARVVDERLAGAERFRERPQAPPSGFAPPAA